MTDYSIGTQHTSLSPDGKLVLVVGDDPDALLIDANSGKVNQHAHLLGLKHFASVYLCLLSYYYNVKCFMYGHRLFIL